MRHAYFGRDADALIAKIREALRDKPVRVNQWRAAAAAVAALLLLGWVGLFALLSQTQEQAEKEKLATAKAEGDPRAKSDTRDGIAVSRDLLNSRFALNRRDRRKEGPSAAITLLSRVARG